jgi:hypothetical protein
VSLTSHRVSRIGRLCALTNATIAEAVGRIARDAQAPYRFQQVAGPILDHSRYEGMYEATVR